MTMSIQKISSFTPAVNVGTVKETNTVTFRAKENEALNQDVLELEGKSLSVEDKQKMIKNARVKASGWAMLGGPVSVLYYGLRSNKTVAKKFDLDVDKDKKLIKQIKNEQALWALPGALLPWAGALVGYLVANSLSYKNIDIE